MGKNLQYGEFKFGKTPERPSGQKMKKGGDAKITKVMHEFKTGKLHSGSKEGPVVKNPKQAVAIALSEQRAAQKKKAGGSVKKYAEGGSADKMMQDRARSKEVAAQGAAAQRPMARPGQITESERRMLQMAKEREMDRKMKQAEKDQPINQRMLNDAMNPLSALKEAYDRVTDRSGESATENMKRYGMKKGGKVEHEDVKMDKAMIKTAVHKHEKAMHAGKPLTKLKKGGGVPVHSRNPKIC